MRLSFGARVAFQFERRVSDPKAVVQHRPQALPPNLSVVQRFVVCKDDVSRQGRDRKSVV